MACFKSCLKDNVVTSEPTQITLKDPEKKYSLELTDKLVITHNTRLFRFALPSPNHILGLPVGHFIHMEVTIDGKDVRRAYTPVSSDDDKGFMDLVIKIYFPDQCGEHPQGGLLTQYLEAMEIGDCVLVKGPLGRLTYKGKGVYDIKPDHDALIPNTVIAHKVGMIAGGSGITPMLQLVRQVFKDPDDRTVMWLVYINQREEDILVRSEIEKLGATHPDRFKYHYSITRKPFPKHWTQSKGYLTKEMATKHLPPPGDDNLILMCARPAMITHNCIPVLQKLGYPKNQFFAY